MKYISKNLHDAIEYYFENPTESFTKIAEKFATDRHSIVKHLEDYKLYEYFFNNNYYYISSKEKEPVLYYLEHTNEQIGTVANKFGTKDDTIKRRMEVMGLTYEKRYFRSFNRNAFDKISSEEDAYWLGFILADGYIDEKKGMLSIKLGAIDKEHLYKFARYMQDTKEDIVKEEYGGAYTRDNLCYSIKFSCKNIVNNLINNFNIRQNKSGQEHPIKIIDPILKKAYIRGMIDGDGHIEDGYFKYVGSLESCQYMKNYFGQYIEYKENCSYIYKHGTIFSFELRNKKINPILKNLYSNATIYLNRKYQIAINVTI